MALRKQQKVILGFRCTDTHDEPTIVQYDGLHNLDLKRSEVANANRRHTYFSIKPLLNINKKKLVLSILHPWIGGVIQQCEVAWGYLLSLLAAAVI